MMLVTGAAAAAAAAASLIIVGIAAAAIAWFLAIVIRMAISRRREFIADAGSVELTKNPDAMISALQKVAGHAHLDAPEEVRGLFLENREEGILGLFATHPPIEKRIAALVQYAGGHPSEQPAQPPTPPPYESVPSPPSSETSSGPWGAKPGGPWGDRPNGPWS